MKVSIDIGIKNFGVFMVDNLNNPIFVKNFNLKPYSIQNLINVLNECNIPKDEENIILIEQQLHKNFNACIILAHLEMYFFTTFPEKTKVKIINSKCKNIIQTPTYKNRKNNSVKKAEEYLSNKNSDLLKIFNSYKKKDDMADAITQLLFFLDVN